MQLGVDGVGPPLQSVHVRNVGVRAVVQQSVHHLRGGWAQLSQPGGASSVCHPSTGVGVKDEKEETSLSTPSIPTGVGVCCSSPFPRNPPPSTATQRPYPPSGPAPQRTRDVGERTSGLMVRTQCEQSGSICRKPAVRLFWGSGSGIHQGMRTVASICRSLRSSGDLCRAWVSQYLSISVSHVADAV
jgi:hypothetical protein